MPTPQSADPGAEVRDLVAALVTALNSNAALNSKATLVPGVTP
jgi:hypothetical protein